MNPGAAGHSGLHQFITCVRFVIDGQKIEEVEIMETDRKFPGD